MVGGSSQGTLIFYWYISPKFKPLKKIVFYLLFWLVRLKLLLLLLLWLLFWELFYFIFLKRQHKVKSMKKIDCNQDSYKTQEKRTCNYKALYYLPTTLDLWVLKFIRRSAFCLANASSMPLVDLLICWNVSWHKQDIPDLLEKEIQFPWALFELLPVGKGNIRQITLYN